METNKYIFLVTYIDGVVMEYEYEANEDYIKERRKYYKELKDVKKVKTYRLYGKEF